MGSKGSNQTTTNATQRYEPNPMIATAAGQAIGGAESAAQQGFQMPVAPVAGFTPFQQQAFGATQQMQGMAQPFFQAGANYLQGSAAPVTGQDVANYYNPMAGNVTAQMQNIFGQQMRQATGQATQTAGGVGADRIGVAQANLANQQGLAAGQTYANLYQQALNAAQQQKQMMAGAGFGLGQFGPAAQAAQLQGIGALGQAGAQQQQLNQAQLNAQYQQQLAGIAYPFQTAQYLAGITGGLAPALGGTSYGQQTTTYPTPSALNQALGIGTSALGLFGGMGGKGGGSPFGGLQSAISGGGYGNYGTSLGYYPSNAWYNSGGYGVGVPGVTSGFATGGAATPYGNIAARAGLGDPAGDPYISDAGSSKEEDADSSHGFADGGDAGADQSPPIPGVDIPKAGGRSPIPYTRLPMGSGEFHTAHLDLNPKPMPSSGGGGGGGGSGIGQAVSMGANLAMEALPLLLASRGGSVDQPYQMMQTGGEPDPYGIGNPALYGDYPGRPHLGLSDVVGGSPAMADVASTEPYTFAGDYLKKKWAETADTPTSGAQAAPAPSGSIPDIPYETAGARPPLPPVAPAMPPPRPDIAGPAGQAYQPSPSVPKVSPQSIQQDIIAAANNYGIPPNIALRLFHRESGFNQGARGAAGEVGVGQLMPGTAKDLGVDPYSLPQNIDGSLRYLKQQYDRFGDWHTAAMAYNAGPNAVARGRIPASSRAYADDVASGQSLDMSARSRMTASAAYPLTPQGGADGFRNPFQMAQNQLPYPDALSRDWGQNLTRSPWMSLVKAGAEMASTVGPVGTAIGRGIKAGAGELEGQRKSLQTEEAINMKAQALAQQAQIHLDAYQKMRYQPINMEVTNADGTTSIVPAHFDPQSGQYFDPENKPIKGGKLVARQTGAESETAKSNQAHQDAVKDPEYLTNPLETINRWRRHYGLNPRGEGELGQSPDMALPDPGEGRRKPNLWYFDKASGKPRQWQE